MNSSHKNILIVFDASGCAPLSMHIAAELAATMKSDIQALYIEDNDLLNAVDLPFTREVSLHTAVISSINSTLMMQKFRAEAENIKKQIEKIAVTRSVSFSFSSMRGQKIQIIKNWADEVTMMLIPAVYSGSQKQQRLLQHEVVVVYDKSDPSCDKALDIALSQAAKKNHPLFIIVDSEQSKQHVEQMLGQQGAHAICQVADFSKSDAVLLLLYRHVTGLIVLPEHSRLIKDEHILQKLIDSLESDILLVR